MRRIRFENKEKKGQYNNLYVYKSLNNMDLYMIFMEDP